MRKLVREVHAECTMRQRGRDGILKVVDAVAAIFTTIAIVDPGVRVLVHKQRHADRREVAVAFVTIAIAPQRVPRSRGDRMRRRSDREHVENRVFAVRVPTWFQKTGFRFPAVREQQRVTVEHPAEVDAFVDLRGEANDLCVGREALSNGQNPGEQ